MERKTDAFVETAGSDATADSDGKCNVPHEDVKSSTVSKVGGEQISTYYVTLEFLNMQGIRYRT
jgi:hypothetical protein